MSDPYATMVLQTSPQKGVHNVHSHLLAVVQPPADSPLAQVGFALQRLVRDVPSVWHSRQREVRLRYLRGR